MIRSPLRPADGQAKSASANVGGPGLRAHGPRLTPCESSKARPSELGSRPRAGPDARPGRHLGSHTRACQEHGQPWSVSRRQRTPSAGLPSSGQGAAYAALLATSQEPRRFLAQTW